MGIGVPSVKLSVLSRKISVKNSFIIINWYCNKNWPVDFENSGS